MNTRFYNARILTMVPGEPVMNGEIWVAGNRIKYIGTAKEHGGLQFHREINVSGNLIMPGFKNAHTHSPMTFLRSHADDLPLLEWLDKQVFPMEAKLTGDDVYHLSKLAIMEYLTSGITANFDMYMFPRDMARASIDCGFRSVFCSALSNFVGSVEELEEDYLYFSGMHELVSAQLAFHAEYTCSKELLERVAAVAQRLKAPVYTHNSESRSEVDSCVERYGMSPTAFLDSLGMFAYGGGGFHCVHLDDNDLEIFKRRGMWAVTNPASNAKLASGIARIKDMLDMGIPVAIGTDGPASNNCLDFFREMFLVTALQKLRENDASVVPADRVLEMAATGGARAMGLPDCDCLAPGKLADLIVIDLMQPNMQPLNNIPGNVVYAGSKANIKLTMVNGKILYEDGRFDIGVDALDVYAHANEIILRMRG